MIHAHEHGGPVIVLLFTWQNAVITIIHLVLWVLFVRRFGHKLTGEAKVLRHGSILIGSSLLWPLVDMGLLIAGIFHFGGRLVDLLIKR